MVPCIRRVALATALLLASAAPALALEVPIPGHADGRIRHVPYEPGNVVSLATAPGAVLVVEFAPDERVVNVAASDSVDLMAKPSGNFLFFKPMADLPAQPVAVLTRTGSGALRAYSFQFTTVASTLGPDANVDYAVRFTYPHDAYERRMARRRERRAQERRAATQETLREAVSAMASLGSDPYDGTRNYRYVARGDRALAPRWVWDNGYSTAFVFPAMQRIPSLYRINPDGAEASANYSVHGNTVIAPGTAPEWRLRDGRTVLEVYDLAYSPIGATPGTHTISPYVSRTIRGARH